METNSVENFTLKETQKGQLATNLVIADQDDPGTFKNIYSFLHTKLLEKYIYIFNNFKIFHIYIDMLQLLFHDTRRIPMFSLLQNMLKVGKAEINRVNAAGVKFMARL